jgi:hypothetical protein
LEIRTVLGKLFLALTFVVLGSQFLHAIEKTVALTASEKSFHISVPKGWNSFKNQFGMPYSMIGPQHNGRRPILSISSTSITSFKFDDNALSAKEEEYKMGKAKWLNQRKGKLIGFLPYRIVKNRRGLELRKIGTQYSIGENNFSEQMIIFVCGKSLVFMNTLSPMEQKRTDGIELEDAIANVDCT